MQRTTAASPTAKACSIWATGLDQRIPKEPPPMRPTPVGPDRSLGQPAKSV